jgi:hypothetical protein
MAVGMVKLATLASRVASMRRVWDLLISMCRRLENHWELLTGITGRNLINDEADIAPLSDWNYCADRIGGQLGIEIHVLHLHTLFILSVKRRYDNPILTQKAGRSGH